MRLLLTDQRLIKLILIGPFRVQGDFVVSRFGANVSHTVNEGSAQEKADFLNALMRCKLAT